MSLQITYKPLEDYLKMVADGVPFSISRIWDGEMSCITGRQGKNSDDCRYTPELRERLCKTITNNYDYYHSVYDPVNHSGTVNLQATFHKWVKENSPAVKWYDSMIWQRCFEAGEFHNIIVKVLRTKKVLFVGGIHLKQVPDRLGFTYLETPHSNSYSEFSKIEMDVLKQYPGYDVIIFCCGMATNCFIDDLYPLIGGYVTMLDMGSVWDAYLGYQKRIWIKRLSPLMLRKSMGE